MAFFMKSKKSREERRRFNRFEFWFKAEIRTDHSHKVEVNCRNLSVGGMYFSSSTQIPVSTLCFIELDLPMLQEKVVFKGVVLRSDFSSQKGDYETALSFVNLDEKMTGLLKRIQAIYS